MLVAIKNYDPSVKKKLAVYPDLPKFAAAYGNKPGSEEYQKAKGDLVLLRSTYSHALVKTRQKREEKRKHGYANSGRNLSHC